MRQIEGISAVLVLTADDKFNALAAAVLRGSTNGPVFYLTPPAQSVAVTEHRIPRELLFGPQLSDDLRAHRPEVPRTVAPGNHGLPPGSQLLIVVRADGQLAPVTAAGQPTRRRGDTNVLLGPPAPDP